MNYDGRESGNFHRAKLPLVGSKEVVSAGYVHETHMRLKSTVRKVLRPAASEFNLPFILLSLPINSPKR